MSIGISVKIKGNVLNESFLVQKIDEMGFGDLQIERTVNGICINLRRELGTIIYFFAASDFLNSIWESSILCKEFKNDKVIDFRFDKEFTNLEKRYKEIYSIISEILVDFCEEAIVFSNDDTEVCVVLKDKIMLNSEYLWVSEYIKYVIENKADFIIV